MWDNGPNRVSSLQTRLETSGTGICQNRLVLADVTEYIYLPQSTFTLRFVLFGQKKKKKGEDVGGVRGINGEAELRRGGLGMGNNWLSR